LALVDHALIEQAVANFWPMPEVTTAQPADRN
jgi:hypothetical protein